MSTPTPEALWIGAMAAVPVAMSVAAVCRGVSRPATRHAMWCLALLAFVVPGLLMVTGGSGRIAGLILGAPRALSWVWPPERAADAGDEIVTIGLEPDAPFGVVEDAQRTIRGLTPAPSDRADRLVAPLPEPGAEVVRGARDRIGRGPGEGPAQGRRLSKPQERGTASQPSPILPSTPPQSPTLTSTTSSTGPGIRSHAPTAPRAAGVDHAASLWTGAGPGAVQAEPAPPAEPIIIDPVWTALEAASIGARSWGLRIAEAGRSVLSIPAPPPVVWIAGVSLVVVIGAARAAAGQRVLRRMTPVDRSDRRLVESISARLGLSASPRAYLVRRRVSPMVCGGLNPRIILPESLWRTLDLDARRAVLTHELAHLRRRDQWVRLGELAVGVLYWWHPVLWAVRRRIREEADLCCDAWVTALFPGLRRSYAEALVRTRCYLSESGAVAPVAGLGMASARSRRFSRRLTMVMTGQTRPRTSARGVALALAVGAATLVVAPSLAHTTLAKKPDSIAPEAAATIATTPAVGVAAPATPPPAASTGGRIPSAPTPQDAQEARLRELEARLAAIDAALRRLSDRLETTDAAPRNWYVPAAPATQPPAPPAIMTAPPFRGVAAAPASATAPAWVSAPVAPAVPATPARPAVVAAPAPTAPTPPSADAAVEARMRAMQALERAEAARNHEETGAVTWQRYALPAAKLDALWSLMRREDVPIRVRLDQGGIVVEGTAAQHRAFAQFVAMIHPSESAVAGRVAPAIDAPAAREREAATQRALEQALRAQEAQMMRQAQDAQREMERAAREMQRESETRERAIQRLIEDQQRREQQVRELRERAAAASSEQRASLAARTEAAERDLAQALAASESARRELVQQRAQLEASLESLRSGLSRTAEEREASLRSLRSQLEAIRVRSSAGTCATPAPAAPRE